MMKMGTSEGKNNKYCVMVGYPDTYFLDNLLGWLNCGIQGWGWCSFDPERQTMHLMYGMAMGEYAVPPEARALPDSAKYPTPIEWGSMADMLLNSKLIILWGATPDVHHYGPGHNVAYFIRLARERGTPVIAIDPRYSATAETLCDQWIPIKPGTDMAMMCAMAYVLFKEDLYNHEFVEKWVEPKGFDMWRRYIIGEPKSQDNPYGDGVPKSPEWAEKICGIPAETIYELTRLYAKSKPTFLWKNWSVARKSRGENVARAAVILQSMMGYVAMPGGSALANPWSRFRIEPFHLFYTQYEQRAQRTPHEPNINPRMYRSTRFGQMLYLLEKVERGEMSSEEFRRIIGWNCDPAHPDPNPKILFHGNYGFRSTTNAIVTAPYAANHVVKALSRLRLIVSFASFMTPTARFSDIILPVLDQWEDVQILCINEFLQYFPRLVPPRGEAKHHMWIYAKIARALGIGPAKYLPIYVSDESWDQDIEDFFDMCYEQIKEMLERGIEYYGGKVDKPLPSSEEIKKHPIVNLNEYFEKPLQPCYSAVVKGKGFSTKSGKIEFLCDFMLDEKERGKMHFDHMGRWIAWVPNDWRDQTAIPTYQPCVRGMEDPLIKKYPLMLLTPHSRYRIHSYGWQSNYLRENYRHSVWINVADAKKRGINDGDLCLVYNDVGKAILPAYVTSRISPGVVIIHHGAYYDPDDDGVDWGGSPSIFLYDDKSPPCPPTATGCVEIEKYKGPIKKNLPTYCKVNC
jgi:anaerobic dimethyl sulfoxide reductase subunit A